MTWQCIASPPLPTPAGEGTHDVEQSGGAASLSAPVMRDASRAMGRTPRVEQCLADAFLAGEWTERAMIARARGSLYPAPRWIPRVARAVLTAYHRPPADRPRELSAFIGQMIDEVRLSPGTPSSTPRVCRWFVPRLQMGRTPWPVPPLTSTAELARFLDLTDPQLDWLADIRSLERVAHDERLRNYRYGWLPRRAGPPRPIERPKPRLKAAQRRLLDELLVWIPLHDAAHGFVRGRSALTHAGLHTGRDVIVRFDLHDFFASITAARIYGVLRTAGYPEPVAHALTGLVTNAMPAAEWAAVPRPRDREDIAVHSRLGRMLTHPHLPQGAPTSPALANLVAFRLDRRLAGLADAMGARYSRYADDLTFSGTRALLRHSDVLRAGVADTILDEGFALNPRKTAVATRAGRQRVCGIVVNERPNVTRREYDELKAILHNAARNGPDAENRGGAPDFRAHLLGRISWVESLHPERGAKLRARYARIAW